MLTTPTIEVGNQGSRKNSNSHIDASHSRQPLVKGERLVRYEVNAVMLSFFNQSAPSSKMKLGTCFWLLCCRGGAHTQKQPMKSISTMQRQEGTQKKNTRRNKRESQNTRKNKQRHQAKASKQASKQAEACQEDGKNMNCYPKGCAAPGFVPCQCNTCRPLSKLERTLPQEKLM